MFELRGLQHVVIISQKKKKFIMRSTINVREYNICHYTSRVTNKERERDCCVRAKDFYTKQNFWHQSWRFYWCSQLHQSSYCYGVSHEFNIHAIKRSMVVEEFNHSWSGMWSCNKSYIVGNISMIYIFLYCCTSILL